MNYENKILALVKAGVLEIIPGAQVLLFGSRANGYASEESDWDILILTANKTDGKTKRSIQDKLFPLSVKIAAFINITITSEDEWNSSPSYYSLRRSLLSKKVMA